MAGKFEPRSSFRSSQTRPPKAEPDTDLPDIDFGFDSLRKDMEKFTTKFDGYMDAERLDALNARNEHRTRLADIQETTSYTTRNISLLTSSNQTHASTLAREAAETHEMYSAINALTSSRDTHAARNSSLASQIASTKTQISQRLAAQAAYAEKVAAQASLNDPELAFYEEYLGLRIESRGDDEIAFVFTAVDERDAERECEVVLDLSRRDYAVRTASPKLGDGVLKPVLGRLNEGRDLAPFLKEVRGLFRRRCREGA